MSLFHVCILSNQRLEDKGGESNFPLPWASVSGFHLAPPKSSGACLNVGAWRSLVARLVRDEEAVGSNPAAPTIQKRPRLRGFFWPRAEGSKTHAVGLKARRADEQSELAIIGSASAEAASCLD